VDGDEDMARLLWVIVVMAILETAWALFAAATGVNILLFYAVLVAASTIFWVPGLAPEGDRSAKTKG